MAHPFVKLIEDLRSSGHPHHVALANNLQCDLPYDDEPAPPRRVPGFGRNIPLGMAEIAASDLCNCTATDCTSPDFPLGFQKWICCLPKEAGKHAFELPENEANKTSPEVKCVRYVSLRAFLSQAEDLSKDDRRLHQANIRATTERLLRKHRSPGAPPSSKAVWLHLKDDHSKIVFVGPDDEAPDRQGVEKGLSGDKLACYVIQRMALPGFENAKRRADRGGFVALSFVPDGLTPSLPLYKPTTLDAADNMFFRPGPTDDKHGLTDTLKDSLAEVTGIPGCKEWVTRNGFVPLAPSTKHGQTWRFVAYFDQPEDTTSKLTTA